MSTYREAVLHARGGGTITRQGRTVRLLTQEEANAYALEHNPSRRVTRDADGKVVTKNGQIVVEEFGDGHPQRLGLFDVGGRKPEHFAPTDDDMFIDPGTRELRTDWVRVGIDDISQPEPVAPEVVDEVLAEAPPNE